MINYIIRRIGYGILILIGVNLFTFMLFFTVNTPDDMARMNIGGKRVTQDAIEKWKVERGYNKPLSVERGKARHRQADRHDLLRTLGAAVRVPVRRLRQRARHRPRVAPARGPVDRARHTDVPAGHLRRHRVLAADGVLPQHLPRILGRDRRGVPAVDLGALLHHRRPVLLQQDAEARPHFGFLRRLGPVRIPGAAHRHRHRVALGRRVAVLPHDVPRGGGQGLRAHRPLQGTVRERGPVPSRAAQRAAADPDQHRGRAAAACSWAR